jgi:hypothetical protein
MKVMFITGSCNMRDKYNNLIPFEKEPFFIKTFTAFGDELVYPEIYWYEGDYLFPYLEKIVEKEHIDMIIGYSAGGHLGFHLCNKYKIKGLHFNPAIASTSEAPTLQTLPEDYKDIPVFGDQMMIIGERDRKNIGGVDAHLVIDFLLKVGFEEAGGEIMIIPGLEHSVPGPLFKMAFDYFREQHYG